VGATGINCGRHRFKLWAPQLQINFGTNCRSHSLGGLWALGRFVGGKVGVANKNGRGTFADSGHGNFLRRQSGRGSFFWANRLLKQTCTSE